MLVDSRKLVDKEEKLSAEEAQRRTTIIFKRWLVLIRGLVGSLGIACVVVVLLLSLNKGGQPSQDHPRRSGTADLGSLRAIPWIFAWTQTRLLLPSWLGVGQAMTAISDKHGQERLQSLTRNWPFFRSLVDLPDQLHHAAVRAQEVGHARRVVLVHLAAVGLDEQLATGRRGVSRFAAAGACGGGDGGARGRREDGQFGHGGLRGRGVESGPDGGRRKAGITGR